MAIDPPSDSGPFGRCDRCDEPGIVSVSGAGYPRTVACPAHVDDVMRELGLAVRAVLAAARNDPPSPDDVCPDCGGTGWRERRAHAEHDRPCPTCRGTGRSRG